MTKVTPINIVLVLYLGLNRNKCLQAQIAFPENGWQYRIDSETPYSLTPFPLRWKTTYFVPYSISF